MGGRRDGDNSTLKPDLFPGLIAVTQQATNSISVYMYIIIYMYMYMYMYMHMHAH